MRARADLALLVVTLALAPSLVAQQGRGERRQELPTIFVTASDSAAETRRGDSAGREAARTVGSMRWTLAGGAVGLVSVAGAWPVVVLGTAIAAAGAGKAEVALPLEAQVQLIGESSLYQEGFARGYASQVRGKRRLAGAIGVLAAAAAASAIAISAAP